MQKPGGVLNIEALPMIRLTCSNDIADEVLAEFAFIV